MYTETPNWKDLLFAGLLLFVLPIAFVLTMGYFLMQNHEQALASAKSTAKPSPSASAQTPVPKNTPQPTPKPTPSPFQTKAHPPLSKEIERLAKQYQLSQPGIVVIDLKTGQTGILNPNKSFPSASLIKFPVMYQVFREIESGALKPEDKVIISKTNLTASVRLANDKDPILQAGQSLSVQKLTELMIKRSDNVATNSLMDLIDREALNSQLIQLGIKNTRLAHKLSGTAQRVSDKGYKQGKNITTAWDMGTLLLSLATDQLLSPTSNQKMLAILSQQLDKTKIPAQLPPEAKVFHKTGETNGATHDIAIIQGKNSHYIFCLLSDRARGSRTYRNMAKFSRDLYLYLEKQVS